MLLNVKILTRQSDVMFCGMEKGVGGQSGNLRTQQSNYDHSEWLDDQISGHLSSLEVVTRECEI